MAEDKTETYNVWLSIKNTVLSYNEETYELEQTDAADTYEEKNCKRLNLSNGKKAYLYTKDDKKEIWVYDSTNDGIVEKNAIPERSWYIKLVIKGIEHQNYLYVNLIRTYTDMDMDINYKNRNKLTLNIIFPIIKEIADTENIKKITLQDDADFPCHEKADYGLKAVYLRALNTKIKIDERDWNTPGDGKLSIYQSKGFKPTKYIKTNIISCINVLRAITCLQLKNSCKGLIKILDSILNKGSNYSIYKMVINDRPEYINEQEPIPIEYKEIPEVNYPSICQNYIKNLKELLSVLPQNEESNNLKIYDCYNILCTENEDKDCCSARGNLLLNLKTSINSNVIIIKGIVGEKSDKRIDTCCDSKIYEKKLEQPPKLTRSGTETLPKEHSSLKNQAKSQSQPTPQTKKPEPIIVTKLFNLFYGTFEKLKYIYHDMELTTDDKFKNE